MLAAVKAAYGRQSDSETQKMHATAGPAIGRVKPTGPLPGPPLPYLELTMVLVRKPFYEFAAELAAGLAAGRGEEPRCESARFQIIEFAPGDWRLKIEINHTIEVIGDESFPTYDAAREEIIDRIVA